MAPGHNRVVPLQPEFIVPQDRHDKQDCETLAARRWLAAHGPQYARLDPVYFGRRSLRPPADLSGGAGSGWAFSVRLQAVVPSNSPGIPDRVELPALIQKVKHGRQHFSYACRMPIRPVRLPILG
jgi:hypothetical protein